MQVTKPERYSPHPGLFQRRPTLAPSMEPLDRLNPLLSQRDTIYESEILHFL